MEDWRESIDGQELFERLSMDLAEITDRYKQEFEDCICSHLFKAHDIGYMEAIREAQGDE